MNAAMNLLSKLAHDNSGSLEFLHDKISNWHQVLLLLAGARTQLDVRLRNGKHFHIRVMPKHVLVDDYKYGPLTFNYSAREEKIHTILMLIGEFFGEPHSMLDVKGKDVVDIGAYIGDTPIYFALRGARHVYALEPYPYSYELAKQNVSINKLNDRITMINAGCGAKRSAIRIKTDYKNLAGSAMKKSGSGKLIPIVPLEAIVKKYKLKGAALKVDCEGCEYDIILNAKAATLRKFSKILIEYHYGYPKLEGKLRDAGFSVRHTKPKHMKNANVKEQDMYGGTILAELG